jgi:chemotaxis signal transduction protein
LRLSNSQDYAVSTFAPSPFSGNSPTFVYAAAVRDSQAGSARALGGIAVVWDAASQLASILADCGDGFSAQDLLAFVDASGQVVASHGEASLLATPQAVAQCRSAESVLALGGGLFGLASHRGQGYREFRVRDGYDHGLSCVVLRNLCPTRSVLSKLPSYQVSTQSRRVQNGFGIQMATFTVAGHWLGLPAAQVLQSVPDVTVLSGGTSRAPFLGIANLGLKAYPVIDLRSIITRHADGKTELSAVSLSKDSTRQLVLVRVASAVAGQTHDLALRVDTLGAVLEVDSRKLQDLGSSQSNGASLVDAVVPVLLNQNDQDDAQVLLSRMSLLWLAQCASGIPQDFVPQDLTALTSGVM